MEFKSSPVQPALNALGSLREDIRTRVGKEGGNLNRLLLSRLDVVEQTLMQIEPLSNMINLANQQMQVATHGFRALSRLTAALPSGTVDNGDDGSSETKGQ